LQRYRLLPGESLILYTGGLYRNGETGFAHFLESLVRYRDCLPKAWYQTVVAEIIERVGESNCHDDMTLVVVSCKKQESEAFV
jgi:serine phosphatase RsbU (regulator of sigma subunit)